MAERIPHADTEIRQAFQRMEARVSGGADPGHSHTGASLSGIDISDDTNLAVTAPIVLTGDTLSLNQAAVDHDALLNTHNLTTDIDHDSIANTHNLTTDIDHASVTNTHNLTTDIDHGSISGTGDDDHTIYLLADGTRDLTGNLAVDALVTIDGRDISVDGTALDSCVAIQGMVGVDSGATPGYLGAAANGGVLRASTGLSYADGGNFVTLTTNDGQIVHDNLSGAVANEHIDHTSVSIATAATSGISGGGTIAATRNLALNIDGLTGESAIASADTLAFYDATAGANRKITFAEFEAAFVILSTADEKVAVDSSSTPGYLGAASNDGVLRTGAPLTYTDGGDFVTLDVDETAIDHNVLTNYAAARHIDWTAASDNFATSGTVTLSPGSTAILIRDSSGDSNRLAIQNQSAGNIFILDLYTADGDGTDNVGMSVFAKGTPTDWTPWELFSFLWDTANTEFAIRTSAGSGGAARPISIYTHGNRGQLYLAADGTIIISPDTLDHDIQLRDSAPAADSGRFAIRNLQSGTGLHLDLYTADGDGTDDMGVVLFAVGSPISWTNYEIFNVKWDASESEFILRTAAGGSGTIRPLNCFTEGNTGQLKLLADGSITMAGALAVTGNITGPNVSSGSDPGHTHTGTSLSSIDISADTNLAVTAPIVLTDDTLSFAHLGIESLTDPGGDRIMFWDDVGAAAVTWLVVSTGLQIATTNLTTKDSEIVHDNLSGYDGNKHVDHTGVSISSGVGLSGGGTIASTRTLALDINGLDADTIVAADTIAFYDDTGSHCNKTTFANFKTALALEDEKVKVDSGATAGYIGVAAGDGVLRTDASITWADGGNFVTLSCNPGLVCRAYNTNWDFEIGDFTKDDDWHDLDLSSIAPSGAYAVYLRLQVDATAAIKGIYVSAVGTGTYNNMLQCTTQVANVKMFADGFVKLDANRKVRYWCHSGLDTECSLLVRGWMI